MINNRSNLRKKGQPTNPLQLPLAGILTKDNSIEALAVPSTRFVVFYQNGKPLTLELLPVKLYRKIKENMQQNRVAYLDLQKRFSTEKEQMQEYIFCMWGQSDHDSDFKLINGSWELSTPENFTCNKGIKCHCKNWKGKASRILGVELTSRDLLIIRHFFLDNPDKQIAISMGIALSTYNTHKKHLFTKLGASTKSNVLALALQYKVI